jgi:hypothetical protein
MVTISEYWQKFIDISTWFYFSLAYDIVLVHCLGMAYAIRIVHSVDPWCYPGEEIPATVAVRSRLQSAVDTASSDGIRFNDLTSESISAYLLSPLLLPKGKRPSLVRVPRLMRAAPDVAPGAAADDAYPASASSSAAAAADDPSADGGGSAAAAAAVPSLGTPKSGVPKAARVAVGAFGGSLLRCVGRFDEPDEMV